MAVNMGQRPTYQMEMPTRPPDRPRSTRRFFATAFIILALVVGLVFVADSVFRGNIHHQTSTVSTSGVQNAAATLNMGAGHLWVGGGAVTGKAVEASFAYNVPGPTWNESHVGGALALTVNQRDTGSFLNPFNIRNDWTFRLGKGIPVDLQINNGAGDSTLDLRGLDVRNLNINQGVGAVHIDLRQPWTSDLDVTVHDGVGDTTIYVPTSVGVQVHVHAGIGSTHASGLIQQNGDYVNASYGRSPVTLRISLDQGVGSVNLRSG